MGKRGRPVKRPPWLSETEDMDGTHLANLAGVRRRAFGDAIRTRDRWDEVYSRNMRSLVYVMKECAGMEVEGPLNEETRQRALAMLSDVQRMLGSDRLDVGRYLSVGPNYSMDLKDTPFPTRGVMVRYQLVFELFLHAPIMFGKPRANRELAKETGKDARLLRDKGLAVKDPRQGRHADVLIGTVRDVDVDLGRMTGRIVAGSAVDNDLFDVTFSMNTKVLEEDEDCKEIQAWLDRRIVDDIGR